MNCRHAALGILLVAACGAAGPTSRPATTAAAAPPAAVAAKPPPKQPPSKPQIDLSSIATQAETVAISLRQMEADATSDRTPARVKAELPTLAAEIDARLDETDNLLTSHPSLQVLDGLADDWQTIDRELAGWHKALDHRRQTLDDATRVVDVGPAYPIGPDGKLVVPPDAGRLQQLDAPWSQTQDVVDDKAGHPVNDDMRDRMYEDQGVIAGTRQSIELTRADLRAQMSATYAVLNDVDQQQARVAEEVDAVRQARDDAWDRLFQRDGTPVWELGRSAPAAGPGAAGAAGPAEATPTGVVAARQGQGSFDRQAKAVMAYLRRHQPNVGLHLGVLVTLALGLLVGRRWVSRWAEADPSLNTATLAFTAPIATALVLSFLASVWIYPQAPRLFWAVLGAAALIPTVYLLRRVVERRLFVILDALVVSYAVDQVRLVAASLPLVARGLFLAEMLGGVVVLALLVRARRGHVPADVFGWVVRIGIRLWLAVFAACLVADAIGYVSLAELAGGAALGGGYLAVILYACTRLVCGILTLLLRSRPLTLLNGVRRHQPLLLRRLSAGADWVAAAFWGLGVLAMLSARPAAFTAAHTFWHLSFGYGHISVTPSHVLVFALTVWASFLVSRFVQFVLDEDVYGHVHLAGGSSYAINRIVHYVVVVVGIYVALAAADVPLTQFSLVVGALTVGLGFGLQNVVNNFVSGLILLFERPIKVGDLVQLADTTGTVEYIGIRASIIRSVDSSEVIVPNGNLLSNQLTNWTRTSRQRGVAIPLSLSADADPTAVMRLLTETAAAHPLVVTQPRPAAFLTSFGADAFKYELQAWTNSADQWAQVRSDLSVALHAALVHEGIGIK